MAQIVLKKILAERNLTYRRAAIVTGVPKSTLQAIAENERDPKLSTLELIAAGLDAKITDLFESDYK